MTDGYDLIKEVIPHSKREVIPHLKQGGLTESIAQGEDHGANLELCHKPHLPHNKRSKTQM